MFCADLEIVCYWLKETSLAAEILGIWTKKWGFKILACSEKKQESLPWHIT